MHFIWVGDESKRPDNCINTWRDLNPGWTIKIWGNKEVEEYDWFNKKHLPAAMAQRISGATNLLRYEILFNEGGFYIDADTVCLRPLPEWLFDHQCFVCWENELERPGLLATTFMAFPPGDPYLQRLIMGINQKEDITYDKSWKVTGPQYLTDTWREMKYRKLSVLPSHYFLPDHFVDAHYTGTGPVFGRHFWGSTHAGGSKPGQIFDVLHKADTETLQKR